MIKRSPIRLIFCRGDLWSISYDMNGWIMKLWSATMLGREEGERAGSPRGWTWEFSLFGYNEWYHTCNQKKMNDTTHTNVETICIKTIFISPGWVKWGEYRHVGHVCAKSLAAYWTVIISVKHCSRAYQCNQLLLLIYADLTLCPIYFFLFSGDRWR